MDIRTAAERLATSNYESDSEIARIYWFPDPEGQTVRLLEEDDNLLPEDDAEGIVAYYFPKSEEIPYVVGIALMAEGYDEINRPMPPKDWGTWEDAVLLWERPVVNG